MKCSHHTAPVSDADIGAFVDRVLAQGEGRYRDFAWRRTSDPYAVLLSEVMLQQTQVSRVARYYERWLEDFPTLEALAAAPLEAVLRAWQGLGYNRRALALKRLAEQVVWEAADAGAGAAELPREDAALQRLPGVGPATAAGVRAFAFGEPAVYLETNVRAVFLHELFADRDDVSDTEVRPLVASAQEAAVARGIDAKRWNYALLDYGAHLKKTLPNPSRRSRHHARQSPFEGSLRQRRARLLRLIVAEPGLGLGELAAELAAVERKAGRDAPDPTEVLEVLEALAAEGFVHCADDAWWVR